MTSQEQRAYNKTEINQVYCQSNHAATNNNFAGNARFYLIIIVSYEMKVDQILRPLTFSKSIELTQSTIHPLP